MKNLLRRILKVSTVATCAIAMAATLASCNIINSFTGGSSNSEPIKNSSTIKDPDSSSGKDPGSSSAPEKPAVSYTVTFETNGGSAVAAEKVEEGKTVTQPNDPTKEGFTFMGWFTDAECKNAYSFASEVTGDLKLYASWLQANENTCFATFYMNDGTDATWMKVAFEKGDFYQDIKAKVENPEVENRHFVGWFADAACTEQYVALKSCKEDISLYADWQNIYTLEAEHTFLAGKHGSGYSGSTTGETMVTADDSQNKTASNGYYVGWMYYNGAYLTFEFESDKDVDDAMIVFRLSVQYNSINVTGDQIYVGVNLNEETEEYEKTYDCPLQIVSLGEMSSAVADFQNFTVAANVSLKKGVNTIELVINNDIKGVGGTMHAAAPLIDCMYLYTEAEITNHSYNPQFKG